MDKLLKYIGKDIQNIEFNSWLKDMSNELHPLAKKWMKEIQYCGKDVKIIFHDFYPMGCVDNAPFAYVNVYKHHMNVGFFFGAELVDKFGLLEGTGKRGRHIKLFPDLEYDEKEIKSLIHASYVDIKQRLKDEI